MLMRSSASGYVWSNLLIMAPSIISFLRPRGVVVVGASTSPEKLGYGVTRNLVQSGYRGAVHLVSQRQGALFGLPLRSTLEDVPDPVDLAILIVPPDATPAALEKCGRRGIHAAIVVSAGFREAGAEGAALERECVETARRFGIRILGPNCIGVLDTHLPLDTTFLQPPMPAQGHIGFISHSGAFCAAIIDWARGQNFGFSQIVSLGNQADLNETDFLPLLAEDEHTRLIVLYLEGLGDGRRFVEQARLATLRKPVLALKVGRFAAGQRAAASHTGALAGSEAAFEAAFRKAGVLRAATAEQLFDWARALEACPLPAGNAMAVLTNAGGPGVIAADALDTNGLSLAELQPSTQEALRNLLPPAAAVHDPVDMLASASPELYAACLKLLLDDQGVHGAMVILPPPPMFKAEDVARGLVPVIQAARKPVVIALLGSTLIEAARIVFAEAGIPAYPFPERAASALAALAQRAQYLASGTASVGRYIQASAAAATSPQELVAAYGIALPAEGLACDEEQAVLLAGRLGYPLVMKIVSPDVVHKSDAGGVLLGIDSPEAVREAYTRIMSNVSSAQPDAHIQGVLLQRQLDAGQEVIAGMVRDPIFGPLMMFGSGGVEVEGLKDVAFALAPLSREEARRMLAETWAGRKLKGFRNIPPADEEAAVDVLVNLSRLAMDQEDVQEIEINPLRVLSNSAVAVDVRWVREPPGRAPADPTDLEQG